MNKWVYEVLYRVPLVPIDWIFGRSSAIERLVDLAIVERVPPGRALALGCGVGRETIQLARHGFDVTGVDFSPTAIARARRNTQAAGVAVEYVVDDLTDLRHVAGVYDVVTDFGAFNDLGEPARDAYLRNVLPLTHPGTDFVMFCFAKKLSRREVDRRFGEQFAIETFDRRSEIRLTESLDIYVMRRR